MAAPSPPSTTRSKLLDVVDLLRAIRPTEWWIGIQITSGAGNVTSRNISFDNYAEDKIAIGTNGPRQCAYLSSEDGLFYWSACDNSMTYVCEREVDRVHVVLVTPDRQRPSYSWYAQHAARIEAELAHQMNASMTEEKGVYSEHLATATPIPPPTTTTPLTTSTQSSGGVTLPAGPVGPPSSAATTTPACRGDNWASAGGRCHHLFLEPKNRDAAEAFCVQQGGHLSSFASMDDQNAFLGQYGYNSGSVWLGLRRDSSRSPFRREDGTTPGFAAWTAGQPSQSTNCATLNLRTGGWSSESCASVKPFACTRSLTATSRPVSPTVDTAALACGADGWWHSGATCYLVVSDTPPVSWHRAQQDCRNRSATLAKITSFELNDAVVQHLGGVPQPVWIGLNRLRPSHEFRWTDGSGVQYSNWASDGRAVGQDMASCVRLDSSGGYWSTVNCNAPHHYVCERPMMGGAPALPPPPPPLLRSSCPPDWSAYGPDRCLRVYQNLSTWEDARRVCRSQGPDADLLNIANPIQQAFLTSAVRGSPNNLWIGLTYATLDQRRFLSWTDESPLNFTAWAPGQPSSVCASCPKTCGVVDGGQSRTPGAWSDVECSHQYSFVCQRPATPNNSITAAPTPCQPPFDNYIDVGSVCYKISHQAMTWSDAAVSCQSDNSSLAYVGDAFDNAELVKLLYRDGRDQYWLGLSDTERYGTMEWMHPWPRAAKFQNWDPSGQRAAVRSTCAVLLPSSGLWRHQSCSDDRRSFVCMWAPEREAETPRNDGCPTDGQWAAGTSRCYRLYDEPKDGLVWNEAKDRCERLGQQLAVVSTLDDFRAVRRLVLGQTRYQATWIGLRHQLDEGFVWADGTHLAHPRFSATPSLRFGSCTQASRLFAGRWENVDCSKHLPFVCMTDKKGASGGGAIAGTLMNVDGGGGGGWGVFGIICLVLVLVVALVGAGLWYARRQRVPWLPRRLSAGRPAAHHSVENLAYNQRDDALSSDRPVGGPLENGTLDARAANRWGSQEQLMDHEGL
ncbi:macrophage mannose receptor 1-like isoform X2 [Pollicipes pollicipes]|uniref:macrophage mannose receptor 1-like isoform X2 n=1 Tax=Pollicipes pollicipes TaxID=41117 RepID=UPI0018849158|nr:macrophage mannose receptor 1-like isoform X2 [Pollicipes pollicipes]